MFKELWTIHPFITFQALKAEQISTVYWSSDASFSMNKSNSYEQSEILNGIAFIERGEMHPVYHLIDWRSSKQRHVYNSSSGAVILACIDGGDRGYYLTNSLQSIFFGF